MKKYAAKKPIVPVKNQKVITMSAVYPKYKRVGVNSVISKFVKK